jgi:hypothetical protein
LLASVQCHRPFQEESKNLGISAIWAVSSARKSEIVSCESLMAGMRPGKHKVVTVRHRRGVEAMPIQRRAPRVCCGSCSRKPLSGTPTRRPSPAPGSKFFIVLLLRALQCRRSAPQVKIAGEEHHKYDDCAIARWYRRRYLGICSRCWSQLTACAFFRFLALSYRERGVAERMKSDADNFYDSSAQVSGPGQWAGVSSKTRRLVLDRIITRQLVNYR